MEPGSLPVLMKSASMAACGVTELKSAKMVPMKTIVRVKIQIQSLNLTFSKVDFTYSILYKLFEQAISV